MKQNKKRDLVLVEGEDWIGIYENGHIVFQDHRLAICTLVDLKISSQEWRKMKNNSILANDYCGHFPDNINELKLELLQNT